MEYIALTTTGGEGHYHWDGSFLTDNETIITGEHVDGDQNSFFVFDLSGIPPLTQAVTLQIRLDGYYSSDASETIDFYDVTSDLAGLTAGTGGVAAFNDLGTGTVYGSVTVTAADVGTVLGITLDAEAIGDIKAKSNGLFALGAHVSTLELGTQGNDHQFTDIEGVALGVGQPRIARLLVETSNPYPLPSLQHGTIYELLRPDIAYDVKFLMQAYNQPYLFYTKAGDFFRYTFQTFDLATRLFISNFAADYAHVQFRIGSLEMAFDTDNNGSFETVFSIQDPVPNLSLTASVQDGGTLFSFDPLPAATAAADTINGTARPDYIAGGDGNDRLDGGASSDSLVGGNGDDVLIGGAGSNALNGDAGNDRLYLQDGDADVANGGDGNDGFFFGGALTAADTVHGGTGTDTLALQGDYSAGVTLGTVDGIEILLLASGADTQFGGSGTPRYSYNVTTSDTNVAAGGTMTIIATGLLAGENARFDGSAETNGNFAIFAGRGIDDLKGGGGSDGFFFGADGNFTGADRVDGGGGTDTLALRGDYAGANAVVLQNGSLANVEVIALLSGHTSQYGGRIVAGGFDYDLTMADGNVAAGASVDINAAGLGADESLRFDGRTETNGSFRILSGAGDDSLYGGAGADTLYGGLGKDRLEGGAGADTYVYHSAAESTGTSYDTIAGFDYREDRIDLPGEAPAFSSVVQHGSLSTASFNADVTAAMNGVMGAGQSAIFTPDGGDLAGRIFAVVDANGQAGYQAGQDFLFEIVNPVVPLNPQVDIFV